MTDEATKPMITEVTTESQGFIKVTVSSERSMLAVYLSNYSHEERTLILNAKSKEDVANCIKDITNDIADAVFSCLEHLP